MTPPPNPAIGRALRVFVATVLLGLLAVAAVGYKAWRYPNASSGPARGAVELEIPRGASAQQVAEILARAGLLDRPALFRLYAGQRGVASRFKAGHYRIVAPATPRSLIDTLLKGAAEELVAVTIPPGKNLLDVADILAAAGVASRPEVIRRATDPSFARSLDLPGATLEGYLYPDTYRLRPHAPAERALAPMVRREKQVFEELRAAHGDGVEALRKRLGWTDAQIVTLASIVEKETGRPEERPRIAQVFINRLTKPTFRPRLLQTDPTIIYGCTVAPLTGKASAACSQWKGNIQYVHLRDVDNPYNTYTHEGLPPGPISNPGRAALEAVMKPDGSPFLYFVARNDGTGAHQFSSTVAEHEAAVVKFQRGGKPLSR